MHQRRTPGIGRRVRCVRCGDVLLTHRPYTVDRSLAATLAAMCLLLLSLWLPFLSLSRAGLDSRISIIDAVIELWANDMQALSLLTLGLIVLLPLLRLLMLVIVLGRLRLGAVPSHVDCRLFEWALRLEPWAMSEIFLLGVVVSLIKIGSVATLHVGPAFWALMGFVIASALSSRLLCRTTLWQYLIRTPC